jgi:hypothetical protein
LVPEGPDVYSTGNSEESSLRRSELSQSLEIDGAPSEREALINQNYKHRPFCGHAPDYYREL